MTNDKMIRIWRESLATTEREIKDHKLVLEFLENRRDDLLDCIKRWESQ